MRLALALALLATALLPTAAGQGTQQACPGAPPAVLFAEVETSLENLAFDGRGHLYVTNVGSDRILRFTPDGKSAPIFDGEAHGLVWGPDDRLYASVAAGEESWNVLRSLDANVTAFEVYSSGLPTYNGMAFDAAGNLYVSDDSVTPPAEGPDLVRVPAADPARWQPWTPLYGPNGLVHDEVADVLYTVITADQASPVLRLSTTDAAASEVVTYLSYGVATLEPGLHGPQGDPLYPAPKGLDDLTLGPDRLLYIVGHLSGELLRVDPATGTTCVLATGLEEPTSVRIAHDFGPHGGKLFVTTWGGVGVSGIALSQAGAPPAGKVWMFDVGFGEPFDPPANGTAPPEGSDEVPLDDMDVGSAPEDGDGGGKKAPLGAVVLLAVAAAALMARRR